MNEPCAERCTVPVRLFDVRLSCTERGKMHTSNVMRRTAAYIAGGIEYNVHILNCCISTAAILLDRATDFVRALRENRSSV